MSKFIARSWTNSQSLQRFLIQSKFWRYRGSYRSLHLAYHEMSQINCSKGKKMRKESNGSREHVKNHFSFLSIKYKVKIFYKWLKYFISVLCNWYWNLNELPTTVVFELTSTESRFASQSVKWHGFNFGITFHDLKDYFQTNHFY